MIRFLNIELDAASGVLVAPRDKREALKLGMLVKLIAVQGSRREGVWVRITAAWRAGAERTRKFRGDVVSDGYVIDRGEIAIFGPEHVCEWDVEIKPRRRA